MTTIKPIVFGSLVLAALSVTQMDAFARGVPHEHGGGNFAAAENRAKEIPRAEDASKAHEAMGHLDKLNPGASSEIRKKVEPEVVTSEGVISGGGATGARSGQKDQAKSRVSCYNDPGGPGCK